MESRNHNWATEDARARSKRERVCSSFWTGRTGDGLWNDGSFCGSYDSRFCWLLSPINPRAVSILQKRQSALPAVWGWAGVVQKQKGNTQQALLRDEWSILCLLVFWGVSLSWVKSPHTNAYFYLLRIVIVTKLCLTLCNPMECSIPGFPVLHHLLEFAQTDVHWVGDAIQTSLPLWSPSSLAFNVSHWSGSFPVSRLIVSHGQSIRTSAVINKSQLIAMSYHFKPVILIKIGKADNK